ncbi:unnamed protein product [Somion occarium]|uniref:C2H2-type domain-containing protein n=1 Tax=Somion occarium TaxID=3059160 RepID=A0ABP1DSH9_9APHY
MDAPPFAYGQGYHGHLAQPHAYGWPRMLTRIDTSPQIPTVVCDNGTFPLSGLTTLQDHTAGTSGLEDFLRDCQHVPRTSLSGNIPVDVDTSFPFPALVPQVQDVFQSSNTYSSTAARARGSSPFSQSCHTVLANDETEFADWYAYLETDQSCATRAEPRMLADWHIPCIATTSKDMSAPPPGLENAIVPARTQQQLITHNVSNLSSVSHMMQPHVNAESQSPFPLPPMQTFSQISSHAHSVTNPSLQTPNFQSTTPWKDEPAVRSNTPSSTSHQPGPSTEPHEEQIHQVVSTRPTQQAAKTASRPGRKKKRQLLQRPDPNALHLYDPLDRRTWHLPDARLGQCKKISKVLTKTGKRKRTNVFKLNPRLDPSKLIFPQGTPLYRCQWGGNCTLELPPILILWTRHLIEHTGKSTDTIQCEWGGQCGAAVASMHSRHVFTRHLYEVPGFKDNETWYMSHFPDAL